MHKVDGIIDIVLEQGAVALELVKSQFLQGLILCDAVGDHAAGQLVGIPERHPLLGQVVGAVGGVDKALGGGAAHVGRQGLHGVQHGGDGLEAEFQGIHCIKDGFLVLLHILVVGQRQTLHHHQQGVQVAVDAAGLAADQLGDIGVLLLRHDGGAGGKADFLGIHEFDPNDVQVGDIVVYDATWYNEPVIHRVINITEINGTTYYMIKGDHNSHPDPYYATADQINERVLTWDGHPIVIPYIGNISLWLRGL